MDTEKYIELTRRCCQKYGGIDAKGDYHGCESKTCPLGESSEICQRTELALRKEFPDAFQDELEQARDREPVLYDLRLLHPVRPHVTKADTPCQRDDARAVPLGGRDGQLQEPAAPVRRG